MELVNFVGDNAVANVEEVASLSQRGEGSAAGDVVWPARYTKPAKNATGRRFTREEAGFRR